MHLVHDKEKGGDRLDNTLNIPILISFLSFGSSGRSPMYSTSFDDY
jgi:hypothetical protein